MGLAKRLAENGPANRRSSINRDKRDTKVTINIGGTRFETFASTLEKIPGTRLSLLGKLLENDESYDPQCSEYFFDRHAGAFENILHYYRTGELHIDSSICGLLIKKELEFWGIEEPDIESCCWGGFSKLTEHKDTLRELDDTFAFEQGGEDDYDEETQISAWVRWKRQLWKTLEYPSTSIAAKAYAVVSLFVVVVSILIFVLETHPLFQIDDITGIPMVKAQPEQPWTPTGSPKTCCCEQSLNITDTDPVTIPILVNIDWTCAAFFIIEFTLRVICCPDQKKFWRQSLNILDVVCIIPHMISLITRYAVGHTNSVFIKIIMIMRVVRVLRVFKLMKHYSAFKILAYTLKVSTKELFLMVVFLMTAVLMSASIIHYVEDSNYPNIPIGIWWAIVTMTTIGYGDKYPVTIPGYLVGSVSVICGVLVIAFTVPIVVNNFTIYYTHAQTRIKAPVKKKRQKAKLKSVVDKIQVMSRENLLLKAAANSKKHKQEREKTVYTVAEAPSSSDAHLHSANNVGDRDTNVGADNTKDRHVTFKNFTKNLASRSMVKSSSVVMSDDAVSSQGTDSTFVSGRSTDDLDGDVDGDVDMAVTARDVHVSTIASGSADGSLAPVEHVQVHDPEDCGDEITLRTEFERQATTLMDDLNFHARQQETERSRQLFLMKQKREQKVQRRGMTNNK